MIPGLILLCLFILKKINSGIDDQESNKKTGSGSDDANVDEHTQAA